jgi:hypothetical protein
MQAAAAAVATTTGDKVTGPGKAADGVRTETTTRGCTAMTRKLEMLSSRAHGLCDHALGAPIKKAPAVRALFRVERTQVK